MSASINLRNEPVEIDVDSLETSAGRLVCTIKPSWVSKQLTVKKLGTGHNIIYYSIYPGDDDEDEQHGVVIKLYPPNSDLYIDWQTELRLIEELAHLKITPQILLTFNNGYLSNYVLGKTLNIEEEHAQQLIAQKLAEFHSIPLEFNNSPKFIDKLKKFIDLFTEKNVALEDRLFDIKVQSEEAAVKNPSFFNSLKSAFGLHPNSTSLTLDQLESHVKDTSWAELSTDIDFIRTILETHWSKHGLPVVLCLNNMNIHNFLYDQNNKTMSIIDFDHCSYNYVLTDIVSYFLELEHDDSDNKYPQRQVQKVFLIEYLKNSSLNLSSIVYDPLKPTDNELDHICDLCGLLIAPIHLYWALWAFLQALLSKPTSTSDYIHYGKTRLAQYRKHKPNFFLPLYNPDTNCYRYK